MYGRVKQMILHLVVANWFKINVKMIDRKRHGFTRIIAVPIHISDFKVQKM